MHLHVYYYELLMLQTILRCAIHNKYVGYNYSQIAIQEILEKYATRGEIKKRAQDSK